MAIPVKFQQFKAAGIYRVVYDKSTVLGQDAELLRLVVGYSPKGPFNTPVYVKSVSDFKTIFGDISKSLENRGCYFHRTCIHALEVGPILCLNLKKFDTEVVSALRISDTFDMGTVEVKEIYDTSRFWKLEPDNLNTGNNYLTITAIDSVETSGSVFVRKAPDSLVKAYDISVSDWYKSYNEDIPEYLVGYEDKKIKDFFAEVFVFNGKFTENQIIASTSLQKYFTNDYYTEYAQGQSSDKDSLTVKVVPTAKMDGEDIVAGEMASYVVSSLYTTSEGVQYGIPTRISVVPTFFTLEGDAASVPFSKISWVAAGADATVGAYYLTSSLTVDENGKLVAGEGAKPAQIAMGLGADNNVYAANQIVSVGPEFFVKDSVITVDGALIAPSIKANAGDPIFVGLDYEYNEDGSIKTDASGNPIVKAVDGTEGDLIVVPYVTNAFGESVDALNALYNDAASGALAHYVGCILPNFIDNNSGYKSLDILFNVDSDIHHMMMSLNDVLLNDEGAIDNVVLSSASLKSSIANRKPYFLNGYTYGKSKPNGNSLSAKIEWQENILNVLVEEVGLRTALLSSAEIDYRYIVDSFETYFKYGKELKNHLSFLAKEKELCFAILNFPSVSSLVKTNKDLFTTKGIVNINKIVNNIVLPSEANGASFCAFYTPLKFSDGYVDNIVPSAGLVSNLFFNKHVNRYPYSIIAGPNYGNIQYNNLVGPDYHYSQDELNVIEPFGVNCMVYRPSFGTFINANQTAKQLPKSALSSVNVRELVIYLQDEIGKLLQSYQWEFNNQTTRSAIKSKADIICEYAKNTGGIQAYLNVMDESNNTPDIIDNEMCVLSTSIEPGRGAGKMVHELTIYRTGGMSASIKE